MAGRFSGHLLHTFQAAQRNTSSIITDGAMSFDARAHGTPSPMPHGFSHFIPLSEDSTTARQIATLQAKLDRKLGPEFISQRPGPGGGPKLTYAEGWKIINLANEVFGFNGWSSSIVNIATDFVDYSEESKRFNIGVTAIVRVTLRDGAYHEDVGYGMLENGKSKAAALDKCKKEAITDALKRTLRNFGNLLGNCLYDKSYAQEVVKIKVPPVKFDKNDLYRRPEFAERMQDAQMSTPVVPEVSTVECDEPPVKVEHERHQPETPIAYVPRHLRQEMAAAARQALAEAEIPTRAPATPLPPKAPMHSHVQASASGSGPGSSTITVSASRLPPPATGVKHSGLATPIQTPGQAKRGPPQRVAVGTSPLAQRRSASERSVSFAEPLPVLTRADSTDDNMEQNMEGARQGDEEDAFPLSTQDDVLFATVDLGEGDFGRPIDFDEGMGEVSMLDTSILESEASATGQPPVEPPRPPPQVDDHTGSGTSSGPLGGGPSKTNLRNEAQPVAKPPSTSSNGSGSTKFPSVVNAGGGHQLPWPRNGSSNTSDQDVKPPRTAMASMGGFHSLSGTKPPMQPQPHPKPVMLTSARTITQTGTTNALKRSADVMLAVSAAASSTRPPPIQGMGLAQRQQQNTDARRPSDHSEDPKRLKR